MFEKSIPQTDITVRCNTLYYNYCLIKLLWFWGILSSWMLYIFLCCGITQLFTIPLWALLLFIAVWFLPTLAPSWTCPYRGIAVYCSTGRRNGSFTRCEGTDAAGFTLANTASVDCRASLNAYWWYGTYAGVIGTHASSNTFGSFGVLELRLAVFRGWRLL